MVSRDLKNELRRIADKKDKDGAKHRKFISKHLTKRFNKALRNYKKERRRIASEFVGNAMEPIERKFYIADGSGPMGGFWSTKEIRGLHPEQVKSNKAFQDFLNRLKEDGIDCEMVRTRDSVYIHDKESSIYDYWGAAQVKLTLSINGAGTDRKGNKKDRLRSIRNIPKL